MKAITILQPWASLIPSGAKQIETRCWKTSYRGPIAIHAAKAIPNIELFTPKIEKALWNPNTPFGKIIAIVELVDCLRVIGRVSLKIGNEKRVAAVLENGIKVTGNELEFGDYTISRYAWLLKNIRAIDPIPARGQQRLWEWAGEADGY